MWCSSDGWMWPRRLNLPFVPALVVLENSPVSINRTVWPCVCLRIGLLQPQCERVAIEALQLCTLLLPPDSRRKLQLLMRMMSRISQNVDMPRLHPAIGTRTLVSPKTDGIFPLEWTIKLTTLTIFPLTLISFLGSLTYYLTVFSWFTVTITTNFNHSLCLSLYLFIFISNLTVYFFKPVFLSVFCASRSRWFTPFQAVS